MEVTADSNYRPKEKATYQNIKKYVKDNFGVDVHTRYIAEVKRMCGLEMGENHHKSQKENPEIKPRDKTLSPCENDVYLNIIPLGSLESHPEISGESQEGTSLLHTRGMLSAPANW